MDSELQRRLASNEAVFREVNEGIQRGQWPGESSEPVRFRCECARLGCNLLIELTPSAYEDIRAHPRRFMMIEGHQVPELERVVERLQGLVVVEKLDEAGEVAEAEDSPGLKLSAGAERTGASITVRPRVAGHGRRIRLDVGHGDPHCSHDVRRGGLRSRCAGRLPCRRSAPTRTAAIGRH